VSQVAKSSRSAGAQPGYCPACFALIDATIDRCPACGLDIARLGARDYRDKLLAALLHPLAEVRMRAIISIGWRRESEAAPLLVDCALRHPTDVVEGLQVVESLGAMRDSRPGEQALRTLTATHPARAVRSAAQRKLGH
jgi:hypothetical protein